MVISGQLGSQVVDITQQIVPMFGKGLLGAFSWMIVEFVHRAHDSPSCPPYAYSGEVEQ